MNVEEEYKEFSQSFSDEEELCHMIMICNFLQCQSLLDLLSAILAVKLAAMTPSQIRNYFDLPQPAPGSLQKIMKENEEAK